MKAAAAERALEPGTYAEIDLDAIEKRVIDRLVQAANAELSEGPRQAVGVPGNAPSFNPFELVHNTIKSYNKTFDEIRTRWYKTQESIRKLHPLDDGFEQAMFELRFATQAYVEQAEQYVKVFSGNRL